MIKRALINFMKNVPYKWDYKLLKRIIKSEILASIKQMPKAKIIRKNINEMLFEFDFTLDPNKIKCIWEIIVNPLYIIWKNICHMEIHL